MLFFLNACTLFVCGQHTQQCSGTAPGETQVVLWMCREQNLDLHMQNRHTNPLSCLSKPQLHAISSLETIRSNKEGKDRTQECRLASSTNMPDIRSWAQSWSSILLGIASDFEYCQYGLHKNKKNYNKNNGGMYLKQKKVQVPLLIRPAW